MIKRDSSNSSEQAAPNASQTSEKVGNGTAFVEAEDTTEATADSTDQPHGSADPNASQGNGTAFVEANDAHEIDYEEIDKNALKCIKESNSMDTWKKVCTDLNYYLPALPK